MQLEWWKIFKKKVIYLFINYNTITYYIPNNFDHLLGVVSQTRVSDGNWTHASSLAHYPLDYQSTQKKKKGLKCRSCWIQTNFTPFQDKRRFFSVSKKRKKGVIWQMTGYQVSAVLQLLKHSNAIVSSSWCGTENSTMYPRGVRGILAPQSQHLLRVCSQVTVFVLSNAWYPKDFVLLSPLLTAKKAYLLSSPFSVKLNNNLPSPQPVL